MNEYGREVAKKMESYMGNTDSVAEEISDIQNAQKGVEVRGALAAGVKKAFDKSKTAQIKSEEATEITQNLLDDSFDTSKINANFEQRLDTEIANLQPEWTGFKDDVTSQLAEIVLNIKTLGAKGNGIDSDVGPILEGSNSNVVLGFPSGTYVIDEHVLIENKKNLKWIALGEVVLLDKGRKVLLDDGSEGLTAVGIEFVNCEITFEGNFTHQVDSIRGLVSDAEEKNKIVPSMDFKSCSYVDFSIKAKGNGLPWGVGANGTTGEGSAFDEMQFYRYRFWDCKTVFANNLEIVKHSGGGEYFGFNKVEDLRIYNFRHTQADSPRTFWSYGKIIDCNDVVISFGRIQSESDGSFIDVSGDNIIIEDLVLDYPNGKLIDITNEWGRNNIDTKKVVIRNCKTNSDRIAFMNFGDYTNLKTVQEVIIDGVEHYTEDHHPSFINNPLIRNLVIRNMVLRNYSYINQSDVDENTDLLEWQNVLIEKVVICATKNTLNNHTTIETRGLTEVKDSYVNLDRKNRLSLRERRLSGYRADLTDSDFKILFKNVTFENTHIEISANVEFRDCKFINCNFTTRDLDTRTNPSVAYLNCDFYFNNVDEIGVPPHLFDVTNSYSSINILVMENVKISGKTYVGGVFTGLSKKAEMITFSGFEIDMERWSTDKKSKRELSALIILDDIQNDTNTADFFIDKSYIKGTFMRLRGANFSSSKNVIQITQSNFSNYDSDGAPSLSIYTDGTSTIFSNIIMRVANNIFSANDASTLNLNDNFASKAVRNNTEDFPLV